VRAGLIFAVAELADGPGSRTAPSTRREGKRGGGRKAGSRGVVAHRPLRGRIGIHAFAGTPAGGESRTGGRYVAICAGLPAGSVSKDRVARPLDAAGPGYGADAADARFEQDRDEITRPKCGTACVTNRQPVAIRMANRAPHVEDTSDGDRPGARLACSTTWQGPQP